jgi:hypothetical protein
MLMAMGTGVAAATLSAPGAWGAESAGPKATQAKVISVQDNSRLHLVKAVGNVMTEEGRVAGTLPGKAKIKIDLEGSGGTATARFTLYASGGSISGHGSGRGNEGHGGWESFSATTWLSGGTGRYAHASGSGHMYGALNRRDDELVVQTTVRMHY